MNFRKQDPGAVQFGNFINYYEFNSAEERLKLLPKDVWRDNNEPTRVPYLLLDVGCNSGKFTQLLYDFLPDVLEARKQDIFILGIDIDERLIERACAENKYPENVHYLCMDVMDLKFETLAEKFLSQHQQTTGGKLMFDAICCFSITMWIHLNHDDDGLKQFLNKLCKLAHLFVVEPQPWKCYQTAERRLKKAGEEFPLFMKLRWRSNVEHEIQKYLEESLNRKKVAECDPTKWKRRICFYR